MAELTAEQWKAIAEGHLATNKKLVAMLREIQEIAVNGTDENVNSSEMREMLLDIFIKIMDYGINPTPPKIPEKAVKYESFQEWYTRGLDTERRKLE